MLRSLARGIFFLTGLSFFAAGCATKGYVSKQIYPLQSQMAAMTDELVRIDQAVQDTRGAVQQQGSGAGYVSAPSGAASSRIYRTPSGFELPSVNIQQALKNAGYYHGNIDGKIGPATETAVRSFQRDNGLQTDGIVGRNTWEKLKVYLSTIK